MRPLPALSLAYFGSSALGKIAFPIGATVAVGFGAGAGLASADFGAAGVVAAGVVAAAADPHAALRKSFQFWPLSEPAVCAALYLALHSCIVRACARIAADMANAETAIADSSFIGCAIVVLSLKPRLFGRLS